jgi:hypothetical protein
VVSVWMWVKIDSAGHHCCKVSIAEKRRGTLFEFKCVFDKVNIFTTPLNNKRHILEYNIYKGILHIV